MGPFFASKLVLLNPLAASVAIACEMSVVGERESPALRMQINLRLHKNSGDVDTD